jgi:hypothetical protein
MIVYVKRLGDEIVADRVGAAFCASRLLLSSGAVHD